MLQLSRGRVSYGAPNLAGCFQYVNGNRISTGFLKPTPGHLFCVGFECWFRGVLSFIQRKDPCPLGGFKRTVLCLGHLGIPTGSVSPSLKSVRILCMHGGGTQNTPLGGPWGGGVHEERPLRARAVFQVVSRPFAQDLAEPVEALVPDGGDKVEGGAEVVSVLASSRWVRLAP